MTDITVHDAPEPVPTVVVNTGETATFTQADLDRTLGERLSRERAKFADYDDLKAKASRLAELEDANASELEKAIKAARDEGRAEVTTAANSRLTAAEARALAAEMGFRKPAHAVRLINLAEVKVDADGEVDTAAVRRLLDDLVADDPLLLAVPDDGRPKGNVDQGPRDRAVSTNPRQADLDQIEADMAASRRK